jgi:hypothetical protein
MNISQSTIPNAQTSDSLLYRLPWKHSRAFQGLLENEKLAGILLLRNTTDLYDNWSNDFKTNFSIPLNSK